jgi:processive 1,2-diacylglycerol beta-glucosyltransferase
MMMPLLHDRFMQHLKNDPPCLIVSVHPMFNSIILSVLQEHNLKIPFITLLADLVDIHPMWVDARADCILCPTDESIDACISLGAPRSILHRCGFPTRRAFTDAAKNAKHHSYSSERHLECLLMSGGEGSGNLRVISEHLLNNFNSRVTVICGRNTRMKSLLEKHLQSFGERVRILGFCTNVQDYMMEADVVIMRGSPNSMLEAVVCNVPLIITGSLPGQEASNPEYARKNGLGIICLNSKQLTPLLNNLLENNAAGLNDILEKQRVYRNLDSALEIARLLAERSLDAAPAIPDFEQRFPLLMQAAELYRKLETSTVNREE